MSAEVSSTDAPAANAAPRTRQRVTPPSFANAIWRIARISPFHVLRGRRAWGVALFLVLPSVVSLALWLFGGGHGLGLRGFLDFAFLFFGQATVPVSMLFLAAGAIGDDIDDGTILYLRLRPIPRASIVLGRFLVVVFDGLLLVVPALLLMYVIQLGYRGAGLLLAARGALWMAMLAVSLSVCAYAGAFLLLSLLFRHAVLIGMGLILVWEFGLSKIPVPAARLTVAFHANCLIRAGSDEGVVLNQILRPFDAAGLIPAPLVSALCLLLAALTLAVLAGFVFARREYAPQSGDA